MASHPVCLRLTPLTNLPACPPIDLQLALANNLPATLPIHRQLALATDPPAQPSGQPAACAADRLSGSAFRPTCDRRRLPIHRPCLPMNLQLAPSIHLPARPSSQSPAFAFDRPSGPAFKPNLRLSSVAASADSAFRPLSSLRLRSIFQPNLPTSLRLAPSIDLPAQPLRQPSACASGLFSD